MSALVAQSIEVIRKRIDELGTTEPTIQRQGQDRVLVQVPGFEDSARLKDIISRTARLTFHLVHPSMTAAQAEAQGIPAGYMILPSNDGGKELLNENVALGGESLTNAQPGFDQQTGRSVVSFSFDTRGAITFGEITSKNVGKRFAIVLDNKVITAPVIQQPITGGSGQISGNFTAAERQRPCRAAARRRPARDPRHRRGTLGRPQPWRRLDQGRRHRWYRRGHRWSSPSWSSPMACSASSPTSRWCSTSS